MQTIANDSTHTPAWALPKGKAQTFYANRDGVLHVQSGRAWVTLTTSPCNPQARWCPELDPGDQFVGSGNHLTLRAGQRVVIESWPSSAETNTLLQWQSAPLSAAPSTGKPAWCSRCAKRAWLCCK